MKLVKEGDAIVILAIMVGLVLTGVIDLGTTPVDARVTKTGGFCGDDGEATIRIRAFKSVVPSTGVKTGVAITESGTTDGAFLMQGTEIIDIITSSATAFADFDKTIPCGESFHTIIGQTGSGGYYYAESTEQVADASIVQITYDDAAAVNEVGTFDISAKARTSGSYTANGAGGLIGNQSVDGGWNWKLDVLVEETGGKVLRGPALCFDYNVSAIEAIEVIGGQKLSSVPVNQNENEECWSIAGEDFLLKNYDTVDAQVNVEAKTITIGPAVTFNITAIDFGNYLHNGVVVDGYEDASDADIHAVRSLEQIVFPVGA